MLVCAEVVEGARGPGHGEAETFFGALACGGIFGALVEGHDDVCAESDLHIDRMLRSEEVRAAVEVRTKLDAIVIDFAKLAERENLEAAGVSEQGARPTDEAMQATHAADGFVSWAQIEVIGVAEDDLCAERFERVLRDGLDSALGADGHEDWCFDGLVRQDEAPAAATGGV